MGFFSWECPVCDHSIRYHGACDEHSSWLNEAVFVDPEGNEAYGSYDGYGRLEAPSGLVFDTQDVPEGKGTFYHDACFRIAGSPKYNPFVKSRSASDQGYFVGDYDPTEPKTVEDCQALKQAARERVEREQEAARISNHNYKMELIAKGEPIPYWLEKY